MGMQDGGDTAAVVIFVGLIACALGAIVALLIALGL